ncbi:hypothetical protein EG68_06343 [Paragonimus skrjabini miyazakii]|uniref:Uncharacterized protein n=1 Tax=Paragonimus skrjabini miyazakii TaxID=59628 RepID=A0A8S9YSW1_9TREM|nr:hypothetical protein EG68_06343 [Paragonimus skrjabini miyazakii]
MLRRICYSKIIGHSWWMRPLRLLTDMPRRIVSMDVDPNTTADENVDYLARCSRFAELTSTDNALAMTYLQDRGWDLERAVEDYFEDRGNSCQNQSDFLKGSINICRQ